MLWLINLAVLFENLTKHLITLTPDHSALIMTFIEIKSYCAIYS